MFVARNDFLDTHRRDEQIRQVKANVCVALIGTDDDAASLSHGKVRALSSPAHFVEDIHGLGMVGRIGRDRRGVTRHQSSGPSGHSATYRNDAISAASGRRLVGNGHRRHPSVPLRVRSALGGEHLSPPDRGGRFDIDDDRVVSVDQIIGRLGEEDLPAMRTGARVATCNAARIAVEELPHEGSPEQVGLT